MEYAPWEFILYNVLRTGVLILFAYPFLRDKGRFSPKVTKLLFLLLEILWIALAAIGYIPSVMKIPFGPKIEIAQTLMMVVILLIAIKERPGKLLFVFFMLYTLGSTISLLAKFLEIKVVHDMAYQGYRWTASVSIVFTNTFVLLPIVFLIHRDFKAVMGKAGDSTMWRYIWLVPGAFYLFWMQSFYTSNGKTLDYASNGYNIIFIATIEIAALFIYHMVIRMVVEHDSLLQEKALTHSLQMQVMEFNDLSNRINDARKSRHDLRHHLAVLENIAEKMDRQALRDYIDEFRAVNRLDEVMTYCENVTANAVLTYFGQVAAEQETEYKVDFFMPEKVHIDRCDISVLLGNILENAIEACTKLPKGTAFVHVKGGMLNEGVLAFDVENSCRNELIVDPDGSIRSTKHEGKGFGTESVRGIVERHKGTVNFEADEDRFRVSVVMYIKQLTDYDSRISEG